MNAISILLGLVMLMVSRHFVFESQLYYLSAYERTSASVSLPEESHQVFRGTEMRGSFRLEPNFMAIELEYFLA